MHLLRTGSLFGIIACLSGSAWAQDATPDTNSTADPSVSPSTDPVVPLPPETDPVVPAEAAAEKPAVVGGDALFAGNIAKSVELNLLQYQWALTSTKYDLDGQREQTLENRSNSFALAADPIRVVLQSDSYVLRLDVSPSDSGFLSGYSVGYKLGNLEVGGRLSRLTIRNTDDDTAINNRTERDLREWALGPYLFVPFNVADGIKMEAFGALSITNYHNWAREQQDAKTMHTSWGLGFQADVKILYALSAKEELQYVAGINYDYQHTSASKMFLGTDPGKSTADTNRLNVNLLGVRLAL